VRPSVANTVVAAFAVGPHPDSIHDAINIVPDGAQAVDKFRIDIGQNGSLGLKSKEYRTSTEEWLNVVVLKVWRYAMHYERGNPSLTSRPLEERLDRHDNRAP
jgi:hypothetical protein